VHKLEAGYSKETRTTAYILQGDKARKKKSQSCHKKKLNKPHNSGPLKGYMKIYRGDQKVPVHLIITIQKVTSYVQSVPRQSPDIH
jgi:hypothetical protein